MEVNTRPHVKKTSDGKYIVMLDDKEIGPPLERSLDVSIIVLWLAGGGIQDLMDYHDDLLTKAWRQYGRDK